MLISGKMVERLKLTKEPVCACKRADWKMLGKRVNLPETEGRAGMCQT